MRIEGRGGGTDRPMLWVHAGPPGAHPMGFPVSQQVWDYLENHSIDLEYNRRVMQQRFDALAARLANPPGPAAPAMPLPTTSPAARAVHPGALGLALGVTALAAALVAGVVHRHRSDSRDPVDQTETAPASAPPVEPLSEQPTEHPVGAPEETPSAGDAGPTGQRGT